MTGIPSVTRRRSRRIVMSLATLSLATLIGLSLAEVGLRVWLSFKFRHTVKNLDPTIPRDTKTNIQFRQLMQRAEQPRLIYRMKPGLNCLFLGQPMRLNAHGFRGPEIETQKTTNTLRIATLGDSTTFGWEVQVEERFTDLLENQLAKAFGEAWRIEVINMGVPSYDAIQEVEIFEADREAIKPDAVLIHYDPNDIYVAAFLREHHFWKLNHLFLLRIREILSGSLLANEYWNTKDTTLSPQMAEFEGEEPMQNAYRRLAASCRALQLPLIVVLSYWDIDQATGSGRDHQQDAVRSVCAELGVPVVDPYSVVARFAKQTSVPLTSLLQEYPVNLHPTVAGHRLMAQAIFPVIFRVLAEGRLDKNSISAVILSAAVEGARPAEHGFFPAELWDKIPVRWTSRTAQCVFKPAGRELTVKYLLGHPDLSPQHPLKVTLQLGSQTPRTIEHPAKGYFMEKFDLAGISGEAIPLRITVDRTFSEYPNGKGRELGIALYPLDFTARSQQ
jgi:lysophospholipase L1-like esterase